MLKRIIKQIFSKEKVHIYQNSLTPPNIEKPNNYRIIRADFKNLGDILFFQEKKYVETFSKFLTIGDRGYFGYLEKNCIHRTWVKSNCQIVNFHRYLKYQLKENEEYIHYCETSSIARNRGYFSFTLNQILHENSKIKKLIAVTSKNLSSMKAIEKAGFYLYKTVVIYRIFFFTFTIKK